MYRLDTDHLTMMDQDTIESFNLGRRLSAVPSEAVAVTIVTYEEQMRGWLTYIARAKTTDQNDATLLTRNLSDFRKVPGLQTEDWAV